MMIADHQNDKKISSQKEIWVTNIQSKYLILNFWGFQNRDLPNSKQLSAVQPKDLLRKPVPPSKVYPATPSWE